MDWKWEEIRGREEEEEEEKIQKSLANFFITLPKTWGTPHAQTEEKKPCWLFGFSHYTERLSRSCLRRASTKLFSPPLSCPWKGLFGGQFFVKTPLRKTLWTRAERWMKVPSLGTLFVLNMSEWRTALKKFIFYSNPSSYVMLDFV